MSEFDDVREGQLKLPGDHRKSLDSENQVSRSHNISVGAMSDMHHQKTAIELVGLQKWHRIILMIYLPLCLAILSFSCEWAKIVGKKDAYSNIAGSWEACLVSADYSYIPLNSTISKLTGGLAAAKANVSDCIIDEVLTGVCSLTCAQDLQADCFSSLATPSVEVSDLPLPTGHYLDGFSYLGVQCIIFSSIAMAVLHKALRHPSWLLSTIALLVWFLVAIVTYYTVSPILPVPNNINSTLLSYLMYSSSYAKYRNLNGGDNHCRYAWHLVWIYQSLILAVVVLVFLSCVIATYAERIRYKSPNKPSYTHLKYTETPVALSGLAAISYVVFLAAKIMAAETELEGISNFDTPIKEVGTSIWYNQTWFPFTVPTLDITTIVGICTVMSILRGYTVQSLSAFRLAMGSAAVFATVTYPGLVGAYQFYIYNDFHDNTKCRDYFQGSTTAAFGYPNDDEAMRYCRSFRMSIVSITLMSISMHLIVMACAVTLKYNADSGRESLVHEVYDFDAATAFDRMSEGGTITPKPLLSRASTLTGEPTGAGVTAAATSPGPGGDMASIYTSNPLTKSGV